MSQSASVMVLFVPTKRPGRARTRRNGLDLLWLHDDTLAKRAVEAKRQHPPSRQFWRRFAVLARLTLTLANYDDINDATPLQRAVELCAALAAALRRSHATLAPQFARCVPLPFNAGHGSEPMALYARELAVVLADPRPQPLDVVAALLGRVAAGLSAWRPSQAHSGAFAGECHCPSLHPGSGQMIPRSSRVPNRCPDGRRPDAPTATRRQPRDWPGGEQRGVFHDPPQRDYDPGHDGRVALPSRRVPGAEWRVVSAAPAMSRGP